MMLILFKGFLNATRLRRYTYDDADVTLMILSMFTVAKAILEVLTVLQLFNVIRSALLLLCMELQQ